MSGQVRWIYEGDEQMFTRADLEAAKRDAAVGALRSAAEAILTSPQVQFETRERLRGRHDAARAVHALKWQHYTGEVGS